MEIVVLLTKALISGLLILIGNAKHGQLSTEADVKDMDGTVVTLVKGGLGSTAIMISWWAVFVTSPLLLWLFSVGTEWIEWSFVKIIIGLLHSLVYSIANSTSPLFIIPLINIATGFLAHHLFRLYCQKKFGKDVADYEEWDGYQKSSRRENTHTTIWLNGRSWNPFYTGSKASLNVRSSARAASTSRNSSSTGRIRANTSMAGIMPIPIPSRTSGSGRIRSSSSKKSSGSGCGAIFLLIARFLVQLIILIVLFAIVALYGFFGYWVMDMIRDWADEAYAVEFSAEYA